MKRYKSEKLNNLVDLIKANAKLRKYERLTRKLKCEDDHISIYNQIKKEIEKNKKLFVIHNLRLYYIAYGLIRGKEYKTIENYCKPENELDDWDWKCIKDVVQEYEETQNEENVSLSTQ